MNCARILLATFGLTLCLLAPALGAEAPREPAAPHLFGDWRFGMGRADALRLPGAREGSGDFAGHVLLPETRWAGLPWNVSLEFQEGTGAAGNAPPAATGEGARLVRVCLLEAYSRERLEAVNTTLRGDGFEMLVMLAENRELDFLAILKGFGSAELQKRIAALYEVDGMNFMSFGWFDTRAVSREMKIMVRNLQELLRIVAADTREAEVTLLGADGKASHILVIFSLPVLETQVYGAGARAASPLQGGKSGPAVPQISPSGGKNADH